MYEHWAGNKVVEAHSLTAGLKSYLLRSGCDRKDVSFLNARTFFAFPKTGWLKLSAKLVGEVRIRHALNPASIGEAFGRWATEKARLRRLVFDLSDVTFLDLEPLSQFMEAASAAVPYKYFMCERDLAELLVAQGFNRTLTFESERAMFHELRRADQLARCEVILPELVKQRDLEASLARFATDAALAEADVVVWRMDDVDRMDVPAAAMLTPYVVTLAQRYGVLSQFAGMRRSLRQSFEQLGVLRTISSLLLDAQPATPPGIGSWASSFPMHAFTEGEIWELFDLVEKSNRRMFEAHAPWLMAASHLPENARLASFQIRGDRIKHLLRIIRELADNVKMHSEGVGYFMMHLEPSDGLHVYVGDTGIGLARGLSKRYSLRVRSDIAALKYIFNLNQQSDKRKKVRGLSAGGRGFQKVGDLLEKFGGQVSVRTGIAEGIFDPMKSRTPIETISHEYFVQGTHFHLFIPTQSPATEEESNS